jgi:hypothetical protein
MRSFKIVSNGVEEDDVGDEAEAGVTSKSKSGKISSQNERLMFIKKKKGSRQIIKVKVLKTLKHFFTGEDSDAIWRQNRRYNEILGLTGYYQLFFVHIYNVNIN